MIAPSPTPFRTDRAKSARVIQEAVYEIERGPLEAGCTAAELAAAFRQYAHGAELSAPLESEFTAIVKGAVRRMTNSGPDAAQLADA